VKETEEVGKDEDRLAHRSRYEHRLAYFYSESMMGLGGTRNSLKRPRREPWIFLARN